MVSLQLRAKGTFRKKNVVAAEVKTSLKISINHENKELTINCLAVFGTQAQFLLEILACLPPQVIDSHHETQNTTVKID